MRKNDPIHAESTVRLTGGGLPAPLNATFGTAEVVLAIEDENTGWGKISIPRPVFQRLMDLAPYERDLEGHVFQEGLME